MHNKNLQFMPNKSTDDPSMATPYRRNWVRSNHPNNAMCQKVWIVNWDWHNYSSLEFLKLSGPISLNFTSRLSKTQGDSHFWLKLLMILREMTLFFLLLAPKLSNLIMVLSTRKSLTGVKQKIVSKVYINKKISKFN